MRVSINYIFLAPKKTPFCFTNPLLISFGHQLSAG
jgi:hypothetical protein